MGKTAYFLTTFIGAIPAGFCLYWLVMTFVDHGEVLSHMMLGITITASFFTFLIVLTPLMVLIFYKDTLPKMVKAPKTAAATTDDDDEEGEGFGDAIPEDFDEEELKASAADDDYDDLDAEFDDGDFDDDFDDEDFGDFDYDDE